MPKIDALDKTKIEELLNSELLTCWNHLVQVVTEQYEMDEEWHTANKGKAYELKFRRGGKTLVSFFIDYPTSDKIGVMIIFGAKEREKFEAETSFTNYVVTTYNEAKTFHDGKWVMYQAPSADLEKDLLKMLAIKRKPNK